MQPQGQVQVVVNLIDFGMNLQAAGDAPRINHTGSSRPTGNGIDELMTDGGIVNMESGFEASTISKLQQLGHKIGTETGIFGGYQAIAKNPATGAWHGASESRKDGHAAGY